MDAELLAAKLHRMRPWLQRHDPYPGRTCHEFDGPPFGNAVVTIDPASTAAAASFNRNRIYLAGASGGLSYEGLIRLTELFADNAVQRCFVWLSPGPQLATVREWLTALQFQRVEWTRYPTLLLSAVPADLPPATLEVRTVDRAAIAAAREQFGLATMAGFEESAERSGFHHYTALDAGRPIASAALIQFEDLGYLTYATTVETERRRGAQTALITRRVADARRLGCTHVVSETLTMLKSSLANLQRCGFREICEQEVYAAPT